MWKQSGDLAFNRQDNTIAISCYAAGLALDSGCQKELLLMRSLANLRMEHHAAARRDAQEWRERSQ